MALIEKNEQAFAKAAADLVFTNPFLPERIELERKLLGSEFVSASADWNVRVASQASHPNIDRMQQLVDALLKQLQKRFNEGVRATPEEVTLYETIVLLALYYRHRNRFKETIADARRHPNESRPVSFYDEFANDAKDLLGPAGKLQAAGELPHIFAIFYQIRRAFFEIFDNIVGVSRPIVALRAAVWQSIFSHDMQRYRRVLFNRTNDITTLITGPSGTGKELVARAISLSRYIPFDPHKRTFAENYTNLFLPLNISALSPTLVESELFGHRRGSFTGAIADRKGWLEECTGTGTVFLDEIGELDQRIQVKLLRVLQTRTFQSIGDSKTKTFQGKIIAATNRNLQKEMAEGRFRRDFFYRLCSDMITTPKLHEQLQDTPDQLHMLTRFIADRFVGEEEAESVTKEVVQWIESNLGMNYEWPGNVRELEQCVLNIIMHSEYRPVATPTNSPGDQLTAAVTTGDMKIDDLLSHYCTMVYAQTRSYEQAAQRLGVDRRTVKSRVDEELLKKLNGSAT